MNETAHILVVDDDPAICELLSDYLSETGYRVSTAGDGAAMRHVLEREAVDLVILDLNLPGEDGFSLLPHIRQTSAAGVIMLTGSAESVNEIVGLELGADDYVSKPPDLRHLAARIRAVLRRIAKTTDIDSPGGRSVVQFDGWSLDQTARRLLSPDNLEVPMTTAEFELLSTFVTRPNRVLSREQLLELTYGREWDAYDRAIDNLVSRLRKKLETDPKHPTLIKSVRGVGYVFAGRVTQQGA